MALSIRIDRLTNSIEQVRSGLVFDTEVVQLRFRDKGLLHPKDWAFDWHLEMTRSGREVHGLFADNPRVPHGLSALNRERTMFSLTSSRAHGSIRGGARSSLVYRPT